MAEVSLNWCAVLLLLAIPLKPAVSSDADISYQVGEFNNKLSALQDRLNLFDAITEGNVSVLVHRVEFKDLTENVTVHMNETNRKLANLEDKIESKFNALATIITSYMSSLLHQGEEKDSKGVENVKLQIQETNVKLDNLVGSFASVDTRLNVLESKMSSLLERLAEKESKYDENLNMHMNESNRKLANLEDKIDALTLDVSKQNDPESKFNVFATRVTSNVSAILHRLEEKESQYDEYAKMHMNETNRKLANLEDKIDTRLTDLESKLNAYAATVTNFEGNIEGTLLKPLSSCADVFANPLYNRSSGVYNIQPIDNSSPFDVYCMADPKGGEPWTVVQRRVDGTVDFFRNWTEYQRGFGDVDGNLWIGLDHLHLLTTKGEPQELWVMLTSPEGVSAHAYYDRFAIGNETEMYPLKVLGKYSGDAGDSLSIRHKSMKFSTHDNDHDLYDGNCASLFESAWWFEDCRSSDLNSVYGEYVTWHSFGFSEIKYAHMAIRPVRK